MNDAGSMDRIGQHGMWKVGDGCVFELVFQKRFSGNCLIPEG
jgi:hypothetical protein